MMEGQRVRQAEAAIRKLQQEKDDLLRQQQLDDERARREALNTARVNKNLRRLVGIALLTFGVGAGVTAWKNGSLSKAINNIGPGVSTPSTTEGQQSLNAALGVPETYEINDVQVFPDWYRSPEFVRGLTPEQESIWRVHTTDGTAINTGPLLEYSDTEDYYMFSRDGRSYALKITYGLHPGAPNQGDMTLVEILPPPEKK